MTNPPHRSAGALAGDDVVPDIPTWDDSAIHSPTPPALARATPAMLHEAWASTPPRPAPSEWGAGSDTDGSPLPTPPRVSHVYDLHDHEDTRPSTPPTLRRYRADTPSDATCRPSRHPPPQTPMVSSFSRSIASQRSVGRDLHKLRSSVRTGSMHIPARRV